MLLHCKCMDNYVNTKSFRKKIKEIVQKERKTAFSESSAPGVLREHQAIVEYIKTKSLRHLIGQRRLI